MDLLFRNMPMKLLSIICMLLMNMNLAFARFGPNNNIPNLTITPKPPTTINEGDRLEFTLSFNDLDEEDVLTSGVIITPTPHGNYNYDENSGNFVWDTDNFDDGVYDVFTYVNDGSATASQEFNIEVIDQGGNETPGDNNIAPIAYDVYASTTQGKAINIQANATDTNNDTLSYSFGEAVNGTLTNIDVNNGTFTYTPSANWYGTDTISYLVSDIYNATSAATITIEVIKSNSNSNSSTTNENDPTNSDGGNVSPDGGNGGCMIDNAISDCIGDEDENQNIYLDWSDADDNDIITSHIVAGPYHGELIDYNPNNKEFIYKPNQDYNGDDYIEYYVSDQAGAASSLVHIPITINPVNDAPYVVIDRTSIKENATTSLLLSYYDIDSSGELSIKYENLPSNAAYDVDKHTLTIVTDENDGGQEYAPVFYIGDGEATTTFTWHIKVDETNKPPKLNHIGNKVSPEFQNINFTINATDEDMPADTLTYEAIGLPQGASFDPLTREFDWTPNNTQSGNYKVTFKVSDGKDFDSEDVAIDVGDVNLTPSIDTIDDIVANEGDEIRFTAHGSDNDTEDTITYEIDGLPAGADFNENTGEFVLQTDYNSSGVYYIKIRATDGKAYSETSFKIEIIDVANIVAQDYDINIDEDQIANINVSVPNVTYNYTVINRASHGVLTATDTTSGNIKYTPNSNYNGEDSFTYIISDGSRTSNIATVKIHIKSVNDTPITTLNGASTVKVTQATNYVDQGATCRDVEDDNPVLTVSGTVNTLIPGYQNINYTCTDNEGASSTVTRTVYVEATGGLSSFYIGFNNSGAYNNTANSSSVTVKSTQVNTSANGTGSSSNTALKILGANIRCQNTYYTYAFVGKSYNNYEIKRIQQFLNKELNINLVINGIYDKATIEAVKQFQLKYSKDILAPWGITEATGNVYITTLRKMNQLICVENVFN